MQHGDKTIITMAAHRIHRILDSVSLEGAVRTTPAMILKLQSELGGKQAIKMNACGF